VVTIAIKIVSGVKRSGIPDTKGYLYITAIGFLIQIRANLLIFGLVVNIACGGLALFLIMREWKQRRETSQTKQL
jgi:ABC-type uncharacterized transport system permease subunit